MIACPVQKNQDNRVENSSRIRPTPFPELNVVLKEIIQSAQLILSSDFCAAYLQGSFAVGDFDLHSDVDFIIVIKKELTEDQVDSLQRMHGRIYRLESTWAQHLEGSYFPREVLQDLSQRGKPLWYLDNGSQSITLAEHDNTAVVRSVLRQHGVRLAGAEASSLIDPIPVDCLRQEILDGMNHWGQQILADPEIISNRFYQTFAVLHYCRALHDVHNGSCGSKRAGAEWVKANHDPSWVELIDRAWAGRPNPELSVRTPANPDDIQRTLEFIQYILSLSKSYASLAEISPPLTIYPDDEGKNCR